MAFVKRKRGNVGLSVKFALIIAVTLFYHAASAQITANFSSNKTSGCAPFVVNFSDASTGSPTAWQWDFGNNNTSTLQNPSAIYTEPGVYTVKLKISNSSGADSIVKAAFISVYAPPEGNFSASVTAGCAPLEVSFTNLANPQSAAITDWIWDFGDGVVSTEEEPVHIYTEGGLYDVSLLVIDENGCKDYFFIDDYIDAGQPDAAFDAPEILCSFPAEVDFINTSSGSNLSYYWDFGDGSTSTEVNPTHTFTTADTFEVLLVATDTEGCTDSTVKVIPPGDFKADFDYTMVGNCEDTTFTLQFEDQSSGAAGWFWDFGDGFTSVQKNPKHTFYQNESYTITLITTSGSNCRDTISKIYSPPVAFFEPDTNYFCQTPHTISFSDSSSGSDSLSYYWNFGDGSFSSLKEPVHTFSLPEGVFVDSFFISLRVSNEFGCSDMMRDTITVRKLRTLFGRSDTGGCVPFTVNFSDSSISKEPITDWEWDFGDGGTSTDTNPTHTYTDTGRFIVTLITTNNLGCTDTFRSSVSAGLLPDFVDFEFVPGDTVCYGSAVQLLGDAGFNDTTIKINDWYWEFYWPSSAFTSREQNPEFGYNNKNTVETMLKAGHYGCYDSILKPLTTLCPISVPVYSDVVLAACSAPYTLNFDHESECYDNFLYFTLSDVLNDSVIHTQNTDSVYSHTFTKAGEYFAEISTSNDSTGCTHTTGNIIYVDSAYSSFTVTPPSSCLTGNQFSFEDASFTYLGKIYSWGWDFGDGDVLVTDKDSIIRYKNSHNGRTTGRYLSPSHTYSDTGRYVVSLTVEVRTHVNRACFYTYQDTVFVKNVKADFTTDKTIGCPGTVFNFQDASVSTEGVSSWEWEFGDGNTSSAPSPSHSYNEEGLYNVTLIVTDSFGCNDTLTKRQLINVGLPMPNFTFANQYFCANDTLFFTNLTLGDSIQYLWQFGDGDSSILEHPKHIYQSPGTYNVSLKATDVNGCDSTISMPVTISPQPLAAFTSDITNSTCPPTTVSFFDSSSADVVQWQWNFDDGQNSSLQNPVHVFNQSGSYDVRLIATNTAGCKDTASLASQIKINGPTGTLSFEPDTGCMAPHTVNFTADVEDATFSYWDFGDGNVEMFMDTQQVYSLSHTYETPGVFKPSLLLQDSSGCSYYVRIKNSIFVNNLKVDFQPDRTIVCDTGETVLFQNFTQSNLPYEHYWDFGDGDTTTVFSPLHSYGSEGEYLVKLFVNVDPNCAPSKEAVIEVYNAPDLSLNTDSISDCIPFDADLNIINTDTAVAGVSWMWNFDDGAAATGTPVSHTFEQAGEYQVTASAIYGNGCQKDTIIPVKALAPAEADFSFHPEAPSIKNAEIEFNNSSQNTTNWLWFFGTGDSSDLENPIYSYPEEGHYSITLIAENEGKCPDTITKNIFISPDAFIKVPDAFTPNGDNLNDAFHILNAGVLELEVFRIFNRWGELVFETNNIKEGWDGTHRNKPQDADTYVYYIKAKTVDSNGEFIIQKGSFSLIR